MSGFDLYIPRNEIVGLVFPKQNYLYDVLSPNFHIHVSVSDLGVYIPRIGLPI